MPFRSLESSQLTPAEQYDLLVNAVTPRPIALVSTLSENGAPNLAVDTPALQELANQKGVAISGKALPFDFGLAFDDGLPFVKAATRASSFAKTGFARIATA